MVERAYQWAREAGYQGINFDVVYGLPFQTLQSIDRTFSKIEQLKPDRIAYYSYAHVPWVKEMDNESLGKEDLPHNEEKQQLYDIGRGYLQEMTSSRSVWTILRCQVIRSTKQS